MGNQRGHQGGFDPFRNGRGEWASTTGASRSDTKAGIRDEGESYGWKKGQARKVAKARAGGKAAVNTAIREKAGRATQQPKAQTEPTSARPRAAQPRSYREHPPAVAAALQQFEDAHRQDYGESGMVIAADGTVFVSKKGKNSSVRFTKKEDAAARGGIITHNHPFRDDGTGQVAFSGADIAAAMQVGTSEERAVVGRFNHVAQFRKPGTQEPTDWGEHALFKVLYSENEMAERLRVVDRSKAPVPEVAAQRERITHEQNIEWAKEFGYVYYRENLETGEIDGYGYDD